MSAEILICPKCGSEFDLQYNNDEVVSRQPCKCRADIKNEFKKILEVLNDKTKPVSKNQRNSKKD